MKLRGAAETTGGPFHQISSSAAVKCAGAPKLQDFHTAWALTSRAKYPGRFHLVRFEELIADPRSVLSRLLHDIGLPMSERCLFPSFNGAALTEVFPWGTIRSPTSASNLTTARSLSHEEQRAVSDDAKVMIDALDYTGFLER